MILLHDTNSLETERLYLRPLDDTDLAYFIDIHGDPEVARYIGAGNPRPQAETEQWFQDIQNSYRNAGLGQLAVIRKSDGARIGRCGLSDTVVEKAETPGRLRKGWFFSAHAPTEVEVMQLPELGYTFGRDRPCRWEVGGPSVASRHLPVPGRI